MSGEIVIVRHGETEWSASGRHTSTTDLPLMPEGRERARAIGAELAGREFALVLCSPLRRARETCELAGFGDRAVPCDDLREWSYGDYEGRTTAEIREEHPDWWLWRDGCPGGESPAQIAARVDAALDVLRAAGGDAIAFAHGHVLRALAARWIGMGVEAGARLKLAAGGVGVLGFEHAVEVITGWNT